VARPARTVHTCEVSNSIGTPLAPPFGEDSRKPDHTVAGVEKLLGLEPPFAPRLVDHGDES
jgi:hypothetical protein